MYISNLRIQNFRCFKDISIEFNGGLNVLIGGNNSGKTTVMKALELILDRSHIGQPSLDDFNRSIDLVSGPPSIIITVTIKSSGDENNQDKAIVASWLTKLSTPWEAALTYKFFLPENNHKEYNESIGKIPSTGVEKNKAAWPILEQFLKKYVSRIYGGKLEAGIKAEAEYLDKFDCELLDALRDVESKMFTGRNTLLKQILNHFKDLDLDQETPEKKNVS